MSKSSQLQSLLSWLERRYSSTDEARANGKAAPYPQLRHVVFEGMHVLSGWRGWQCAQHELSEGDVSLLMDFLEGSSAQVHMDFVRCQFDSDVTLMNLVQPERHGTELTVSLVDCECSGMVPLVRPSTRIVHRVFFFAGSCGVMQMHVIVVLRNSFAAIHACSTGVSCSKRCSHV